MLQLLHFGQIVKFWADNVDQKWSGRDLADLNVDQKCNNHVTIFFCYILGR